MPSSDPLDAIAWPVRTERLTLRRSEESDAEALWAIRRLEEVSRWMTAAPGTFEAFRDRVDGAERLAKTLVILADGKVAGDLMLAVRAGSRRAASRTTNGPGGSSSGSACVGRPTRSRSRCTGRGDGWTGWATRCWRRSGTGDPLRTGVGPLRRACAGRTTRRGGPVEIDKSQIIDLLKSRGEQDKAAEADAQLPQRFDVEQYADLLGKLGINVQDLLGKLPGGLGDKLGGLGGLG